MSLIKRQRKQLQISTEILGYGEDLGTKCFLKSAALQSDKKGIAYAIPFLYKIKGFLLFDRNVLGKCIITFGNICKNVKNYHKCKKAGIF